MLRAVMVLLLLANGLIWLWGEGYLENYWPFPDHQEPSQPDRKRDQYEPERLILLPDAAASPVVASGTTDMSAMPQPINTASGLGL